jgi:Xaa-Pro aminopeptidase
LSEAAAVDARLERIRARLATLEVDALLVTTPANRRWLSGFTGSAGVLLVDARRARIATDGRYHEQAQLQAPAFELVAAPLRAVSSFAAALLDGLGGARLGFEPAGLTVAAHGEWSEAIEGLPQADRPRPVPAAGAIEPLRAVKDAAELDALTRAVQLGDEAWEHAVARLRPGITERELAWEVQRYAIEHGAEGLAFETIIAAGPHGAMAHARPRDVAVEAGQGVVMDLGVVVDGYHSDLTRTVPAGEPDAQFRRVYDAVLTAQTMAEQRIEAGMTGGEAHAIAATVLRETGYGEAFTHGLGHGVGLEIHEAPRLAADSEDVLADGQVVTIEPGVYLPGWGGVRIEDQCVMEDGRLRVLSRAAKLDVEVGVAS